MVINLSHIPALQDNGFMFEMKGLYYNYLNYSKQISALISIKLYFIEGCSYLLVCASRIRNNFHYFIKVNNPTFEDLNYWHQQISGNPLNLLEHPAVNRI